MTTAVVILSIVLGVVVLVSLLGEGKRSSMDAKIMELKAENYQLLQENTKLKSDYSDLKAVWCNIKSKLPLNIDKRSSQEKSLRESSS